jgi:DNA-binding beta-propeller fold protein YncE
MTKQGWFLGPVVGIVAIALAALHGVGAARIASAAALTPPGCTTAVASGTDLPLTPHFTSVQGLPFDVVTSPDARFTFVASDGVGQPGGGGGGAVLVFAGNGASGRRVGIVYLGNIAPFGMALADHSGVLLVADDNGLVVIDVAKAERGGAGAVVARAYGSGSGGIEVAVTPDGRFAFESMEDSQRVDVFELAGDRAPRFVGAAPVGAFPVGIAFSPDGRTGYVTSEEAHRGDPNGPGTLTMLRVATAERHPGASVERSVVAGCAPVRVVVSPDGGTVWVAARQSDAVLGFSAAHLAADTPALVDDVEVGEAPVGLALFDGGRRLLVADSNRFGSGRSSLAALDVSGTPHLVGYLPAGAFPREMTVEPGGQEIDVTNYDSSQLETVPVSSLVAGSY